jgi:F0F1-type ATP synthase assembly protein I
LSALAAGVYIIATIALSRADRTSRRVATAALVFELSGVIVVGTASLVFPDAFPRATVWSTYGSGYLFIPLALPIIGLWWLRRTSVAAADPRAHGA